MEKATDRGNKRSRTDTRNSFWRKDGSCKIRIGDDI